MLILFMSPEPILTCEAFRADSALEKSWTAHSNLRGEDY